MSNKSKGLRRLIGTPVSAYDQKSAMIFLAPMMVVLMAVAVFPILYSFWISLFDLKLTRPHRAPFVWFDNYVHIFQDQMFWDSVGRSTSFTLMSVTAIMLIAMLMALLLNEEFRGRRILSAILLIPWAIPYVANGLMWKWIYDSGYGALNGLLFQLGLIDKYLVMLGDVDKTMLLITNSFVWKEVPLATILLLVTLKSIRADLYSAAKVDGANVWQRFIHITLPALTPGFALVMIYETMMAIRHFDLFFILTEGGPADASHVVAWQVYVETFRKLAFGTGAALAYIMAIVTFTLAFFIIRSTSRKL
ncbi:carbohydrate ABC transporter permease [Rhodoferax sp.]|jgi:multiple sugar transport system permease protein|uniref:carbohydrate ABC transporter permease n=1 Tax=Rhodoferax sp. TaxID=50421 RepID=UPI0027277DCC|nr:sugar ABC transporter permease [Rhodoferax sp.]MDO9143817.1 sugar ABC transporter permease [Rhodoferax sp.]MDP1531063.1 sugar ABC transporter permease [Rhodoferax sp.]MDP1945080.1 sugar ABC transporter permease [Rhodoferax sp.]MDP2442316.1 sugar ABC transporter permease [Rhodoferax sp.]MDP3193046.1 sugar ABC transporter permease [Rhodoferax sp.]